MYLGFENLLVGNTSDVPWTTCCAKRTVKGKKKEKKKEKGQWNLKSEVRNPNISFAFR